ncbi:stalk domain-containing protein [Paenibacillus pinistramenti]|uniref:stalk domain-containing protein n=1 Tax=Paenibacillus pinistramenti TaxID=1768003 RepID=UPI0011087CF2|nr:stalk domain-containing protein [Paenibacillus pinistramenti]
MRTKTKVVYLTLIGLLGAATAAGASGLSAKVTGILRGDMKVTVDGQAVSMQPVVINGQVYLPARAEAEALGYTLNYDGANRSISMDKQEEETTVAAPESYLHQTGVIVNVAEASSGSCKVEVLGKGDNSWVVLNVDKDTAILNSDGTTSVATDLQAGMSITAEYGPVMTRSYPGQSHAASITVSGQTLFREDVIHSVEHTADGWVVKFGATKDGTFTPELTVTSGKETSVLTREGQPVNWEDIQAGDKAGVYYGPGYTGSQTPASPLYYMVLLSGEETLNSTAQTADPIKAFPDADPAK